MFSRDVMAVMLVSLNNGTVAMLVSPTDPLGISFTAQMFSFVSVEKEGYCYEFECFEES